ncbi:MAG TPA: hypothetical protein VF535_07240 [Allosphingosinicella sp.]|jgi:hypothetical protein
MRDEMDSRLWVGHGHAFSTEIARFFTSAAANIGEVFRRLNEIQFDAPWKRDAHKPGQA